MPDRPRVLIIAEACNPEWTSVPLVGFNLYDALRRKADVTLVTQIRNRAALSRRLDPENKVVYIDSEALAGPFRRLANVLRIRRGLGWTTKQAVMWLPYLYFEYLTFIEFQRRLRRGEYDLVHRITPLTPTFPSPIASWTNVPFVIGPLNGGLPWPRQATHTRLAEMEWLSYVRDFYRILPYHRSTLRRARCIITASRYTMSALPPRIRRKAIYLPENGIDPSRFKPDGRLPPSKIHPFRILFVGRLVPYKGADVVLEAVGSSPRFASAELVFVGDGPQRQQLADMAQRYGMADRVTFTGALPQEQVAEQFRRASVFAFPSIREFGGAVVMEAMACGLPPIVVDYGGPGELITPSTGRAVAMGSRAERVAQMRQHLEDLYGDLPTLDRMSDSGIRHAMTHYTWDAKANRILQAYQDVLS